jgi:hypothetical protein
MKVETMNKPNNIGTLGIVKITLSKPMEEPMETIVKIDFV